MRDTTNLHLCVLVSDAGPIDNLVLDSWAELQPLVDRDVEAFVSYAKTCNIELTLAECAAIRAYFKWKTYDRRGISA